MNPAARRSMISIWRTRARSTTGTSWTPRPRPSLAATWRERDRGPPLSRLAGSACLWERRIAIVATWYFIRRGDFADTLRLAALLLGDREDLIHKAVGWMLREVGKRNQAMLEGFLARHYRRMPRTMLRYAIEAVRDAEAAAVSPGRSVMRPCQPHCEPRRVTSRVWGCRPLADAAAAERNVAAALFAVESSNADRL